MITDALYQHWLTSPDARRVLLLELQHAAGTEYVSSQAFIGEPVSRDSQHRQYEPILFEAVELDDRLDSQITVGDIGLINDGLIDHWRAYNWHGYSIKGYFGSPDWPRAEFHLVLNATNAGLLSAEPGLLTLGVLDARQQLEKPLTGERINSTGAPVVLGEVFNATPALISASARSFKVSALPLTALDASDRGNPGLAESVNLAGGSFISTHTAQGSVTFSATGTAQTTAAIVQQLADLAGVAVDSDTLAILPNWKLGLFYPDGTTTTIAQTLDDIAASIGGYWRLDALNRLQMFQLKLPEPGTVYLTADDIEQGGLQLSAVEPVLSQIELRYGRNHTPLQPDALASPTVIGHARHTRLQQEWLTNVVNLSTANHPLAQPGQFDTALINPTDAAARAAHIESIRSVSRQVWELDAFIPAIELRAGDCVNIQHDDWREFAAGRWVRVLSNRRDLTGETCQLEVWF